MGHSFSAAIRPPSIGGLCRSVPKDEYDEPHYSRYAPALAMPFGVLLNTIYEQDRIVHQRTVHPRIVLPRIVHLFTSSTMIHFSMSFFSIGQFF